MRLDLDTAERNGDVRDTARWWARHGLVAAARLPDIDAAFPDDRVRLRWAAWVVLFVFGFAGALALFAAVEMALSGLRTSLFVVGTLLAALTEWLVTSRRRMGTGIEAATSAGAVVGLAAWVVFDLEPELFAVMAMLCALAAWRWRLWAYGAGAVLLAMLACIELDGGRWWAMAIGAIAAALAWPRLEDARRAPSRRRAWAAAAAAAVVGIAILTKPAWLGETAKMFGDPPQRWELWACTVISLLVPALLLSRGISRRRRLDLDLGLVTAALAFPRLRILPLWAVLVLAGSLLLVGVIALRRRLAAGPGRGFTVEPVVGAPDRSGLASQAVAVALGTRAHQPGDEPFRGGGGESGGAGASGRF